MCGGTWPPFPGRSRTRTSGQFPLAGAVAVLAGVLSAGLSFSFVYAQDPIVTAMRAQGARDIPAISAAWTVALLSGAVINVRHPAYLLTKNKS